MPIVRLSGKVAGAEDPKRKERGELLYHLFANGWDIYNSNGDQSIKLENIQEKIIESDAFIFTPLPTLEDYFNITSIIVGLQTNDKDLKKKSIVVLNSDNSWDNFFKLFDHMFLMGTVKQKYTDFLSVVKTPAELIEKLKSEYHERTKKPHVEPDIIDVGSVYKENEAQLKQPEFNVCVFCSASLRREDYLTEGFNLGKNMAEKGWGCISGAGKTGIMGEVVQGAYAGKGWSGGSNVPHIIQMEGLPDGLNEFWPRADIYTRMQVMIEKSNAFVIMPGGMGTIQELFALLILKHQKNDMMKGKKIVLYNKLDEQLAKRFWNPALDIINKFEEYSCDFQVIDNFEEIIPMIEKECMQSNNSNNV